MATGLFGPDQTPVPAPTAFARLLLMELPASVLLAIVETIAPDQPVHRDVMGLLRSIDFTALVMNGMLAFLMFPALVISICNCATVPPPS